MKILSYIEKGRYFTLKTDDPILPDIMILNYKFPNLATLKSHLDKKAQELANLRNKEKGNYNLLKAELDAEVSLK